ncbi:MAG: hypothetical protein IKD31_05730 [Clostridia bacterium]|nr:hypothetical protein [Clostridia bacterium]
MISCTEFIPLYSELFAFLERIGGYDAVLDYWYFISSRGICNTENPNSLISFLERDKEDPFMGAWKYWSKSLTEEACDLIRCFDPKRRIIISHMRHCPSRGMLNSLEHITPYENYCEHCNVIYRPALQKYGLDSRRDNSGVANAECRSCIFEKGKDPGIDLASLSDDDLRGEGFLVMDIKSEDNKYLHRDFHFHGDLALRYLGENFGENGVRAFLRDYVKHYYAPQIEKIRTQGLSALREWIESVYRVEEAENSVSFEESDSSLCVSVSENPAVCYLRSTNCIPSPFFIEETRTLYATVADECNLSFVMAYYDEENGRTRFTFTKRKY